MTGEELRDAIAAAGMTVNQFTTRAANLMLTRGTVQDPKNAERTVKRWLAEKKRTKPLNLQGPNRALVTELVGVDPNAGSDPTRLEELAAKVEGLIETQETLMDDLADARTRIEQLEAARKQRRVAPKRQRKKPA